MAEHRGARLAAGARGEHQDGEVLAAAVLRRTGASAAAGRGDRVETGRVDEHPVGAGDRLLDDAQRRVVAEHDLGVGLAQQSRGLRRGVAGVQRHGDQTGAQHGEVRRDEGRRVRHGERDPVADVQAEIGAQPGSGGVDVGVEGLPGQRSSGRRPRGRCTSAVPSGRRAAAARRTCARLVGFSLPAAPTGAVWHSQVGRPAATAVRSPDMRLRRSTGDGAADADAVAAGQASAAAAEVEAALQVPLDPHRRRLLRRRQHGDAGRLDLPPGPRPVRRATSSPPATSAGSPGSRESSGSSAGRT